ncbi:hypothetical protein [Nitrospira sp. Nam74]
MADGIPADDIRFKPLMCAIDACEARYNEGDWLGFQQTAKLAKKVSRLVLGSPVQWTSIKGIQQATVETVIEDAGTIWVAVPGGLFRADLLAPLGDAER